MRVVERLAQREASWRELEALLDRMDMLRASRLTAAEVVRLGELYRSACTDLMLAESHDLPRDTVAFLHALVGRAHNAVYRAQGFRFRDWARALFEVAPRQLRTDRAVRLSALVFYGSFILCALVAAARADFAEKAIGTSFVEYMDQMYAEPISQARKDGGGRSDTMAVGFYIQHNTSIGFQCFAWGLFVGLGSLYQLLFNGVLLGTVFGHMARTPHAGNFYTFVTAHSVFELNAIVLSGAAGLRLGYGLIETQGQTRLASLRREAHRALPTVGASAVLFVLAACIEGFVSASGLPYWAKASIALMSAVILTLYMMLGGRVPRERSRLGVRANAGPDS